MIADLKAGKVKGVVAWKWDRLGAGPGIYPLMDAIEEVPHPVAIETVTEGEISPLMLSMLTSFRAQLLRDMHDRLTESGKARLESGKLWGGHCMFGYDYVDGNRVINVEEAYWVRKIFEWYIDGIRVKEIRKKLITAEVKQKGNNPRRKRPWGEDYIRSILRNHAYTGKTVVKWDGQVYEITYESIIDEATFQKAQAVMKKNRTWPNRNQKIPYLLSGLVKCAHCEHFWCVSGTRYAYKNGERFLRAEPKRLYRCSTATRYGDCPHTAPIKAEVLEAAAWGAISEIIRNPQIAWEQIQRHIAKLNENRAEKEREAEKLKDKLERLTGERKWVIAEARKGTITQEDFEIQIAMMNTEQAELQLAYQEAVQDIPDGLEAEKLERLAEEYFADCQTNLAWLDNPPEEDKLEAMKARRAILEMLVEEIVIDPNRKTLQLKGVFDKVVHFNIEQSDLDAALFSAI
jgi:site-specific DNA recombinase